MKLFQRILPTPESSRLFNDRTFYRSFVKDLSYCQREVVIESPFITTRRIDSLLPMLNKAGKRGVSIVVNTRNPDEHDLYLRTEALESIAVLQGIGVKILYTVGHHRKLAIIDRQILWEGSLNILSQNESCEIMRRINSKSYSEEMIRFTNLYKFLR